MSRGSPGSRSLAAQEDITRRTGLSFAGSRGGHLASVVDRFTDGAPETLEPADGSLPGDGDGDGAAFDRLYDALTVQESFFFREPSRLSLIREHVLPRGPGHRGPVRVWSAGCARGEEAYTLSMLLTEAGLAGRYHVLGTDLSAAAVGSARRGTYSRWAVRGLDEQAVSTYFEGDRRELRVADRFRSRVAFEQHNLLDPLPPGRGPFELILCRNVLIYFTADAVRRAAEALTSALVPGGWLILGVSDPSLDDIPGLQKVPTTTGTAYRREDSPCAPPAAPTAPARVPAAPVPLLAERSRVSDPPVPGPPTDPTELVAAAEHALALADASSAVVLAHRLLDTTPRDPAGHRLVIQALAEDGRTQESVDAAARAVTLFPEDPRIRELEAAVLLESGQVTLAMVAARQAIYLDPGSALAHVVMARVHDLLGDPVAARRARRNGLPRGSGPVPT